MTRPNGIMTQVKLAQVQAQQRRNSDSTEIKAMKLPYFDKDKECTNVYIQPFEKHVVSNRLDRENSSTYLDLLKKRKALEVGTTLLENDFKSYDRHMVYFDKKKTRKTLKTADKLSDVLPTSSSELLMRWGPDTIHVKTTGKQKLEDPDIAISVADITFEDDEAEEIKAQDSKKPLKRRR